MNRKSMNQTRKYSLTLASFKPKIFDYITLLDHLAFKNELSFVVCWEAAAHYNI